MERETIFNTKLTTVKKILNWLRTICIVYVILIVGVRCLDTVLKENIRYHIKHHQSQLLLDQIRQILTVGKTVYTNRRLLKPRYTLATSRLLPKPATNQRQSQLSPIRSTLSSMRSTLSLDLATNRKQLEFDSLLRSTLSPNKSVDFFANMVNFVDCHPNVERPFDFVASVYGANKVDRVKFNFIASVYQALHTVYGHHNFITASQSR